MHPAPPSAPDYLVLGHPTLDQTASGPVLGGTSAYAALTARAHGLRTAIVTSAGDDLDRSALADIQIVRLRSEATTTFRNLYDGGIRRQHLLARADDLEPGAIPVGWHSARIIHLAPVAAEVPPALAGHFPETDLIGVTPQGWMRRWDRSGLVRFTSWKHAAAALARADAVVVSLEDMAGNEAEVEDLATACRLLVATEGALGARVYWNGDVRRLAAPAADQVDPTGAGDIFAASFFIRLHQTRDPWEAARYANVLAARSVAWPGISGVPSPSDVQQAGLVLAR